MTSGSFSKGDPSPLYEKMACTKFCLSFFGHFMRFAAFFPSITGATVDLNGFCGTTSVSCVVPSKPRGGLPSLLLLP